MLNLINSTLCNQDEEEEYNINDKYEKINDEN